MNADAIKRFARDLGAADAIGQRGQRVSTPGIMRHVTERARESGTELGIEATQAAAATALAVRHYRAAYLRLAAF